MAASSCPCTSAHKTTKLSENALSGLQRNLFTVELEFINLFAVITLSDQVVISGGSRP